MTNNWNNKTNRLIDLFSDEKTKFNRLDRHDILNIERKIDEYQVKIKSGVYSDFHLPTLNCYQNLLKNFCSHNKEL